jgi:putative restriction endonuclease
MRVFGHLPGYPEGSWFSSRGELSAAGVHRPLQAGISGAAAEGADSIVLSGGYEDDRDFGDLILYTGEGGRSQETGRQVAHQTLTRGNRALAWSQLNGLPVRVVRGHRHASPDSPEAGYRYDGLYRVEDHWYQPGLAGFNVWRFRLVKIDEAPPPADDRVAEEKADYAAAPPRRQETVLRVVRDTEQARRVKARYQYRCQMCGTRLEGTAGPYAEAAHIRPLGTPHDGPDTEDNLLCLCPNHHVLFDHGGVAVADDLSLIGEAGRLHLHPGHRINREFLRYRRRHYFPSREEELAGPPSPEGAEP